MPNPPSITNCHTHIFTADQVPPLLGRTLIPFPLYYILNINWLIALVRSAKGGFLCRAYYFIKSRFDKFAFWYQGTTEHLLLTKVLAYIFKLIVSGICTLFMLSFLRRFFTAREGLLRRCIDWIFSNDFLNEVNSIHWLWKIVILLFSLIFFKLVRNIAKMLLFAAFTFLKALIAQKAWSYSSGITTSQYSANTMIRNIFSKYSRTVIQQKHGL